MLCVHEHVDLLGELSFKSRVKRKEGEDPSCPTRQTGASLRLEEKSNWIALSLKCEREISLIVSFLSTIFLKRALFCGLPAQGQLQGNFEAVSTSFHSFLIQGMAIQICNLYSFKFNGLLDRIREQLIFSNAIC